MSDTITDSEVVPTVDEKSVLMQRAKLMGLKVSNNIGLATLKAKINAALDAEKVPSATEDEETDSSDDGEESIGSAASASSTIRFKPAKRTEGDLRAEIIAEAMKLIRIRITCLNPSKKDLPGEIFTVCNRYIGTVRKYVPFGDQTENGYHIPNCIYQHLKERKFLHIRTNNVKRDGVVVETGYVPEFAIEILPSLTQGELKKLAVQQAVAAGQVT